MGARAGAKAALTDYNKNKNEKSPKKIALASFGKRGRGDFNVWSDDDEQASDSSASDASHASNASNASNASGSSRTPTSSSRTPTPSSHTPTPSNASIVPT